jgi:hypothetical protein
MPKMEDNPNKVDYAVANRAAHNREIGMPWAFLGSDLELAVLALIEACHGASLSAGWYHDPETGEPIERNVGEVICLMHSELSEAMEGHRKGLMDDKLPHRLMVEVEMADAVIRIMDFCGHRGLDLGGAIVEKLYFNATRADHKPENRVKEGGKAY